MNELKQTSEKEFSQGGNVVAEIGQKVFSEGGNFLGYQTDPSAIKRGHMAMEGLVSCPAAEVGTLDPKPDQESSDGPDPSQHQLLGLNHF